MDERKSGSAVVTPQHNDTTTATSGNIPISSRCKFGQLRASKRCIIDNKRGSHRVRRNQRNNNNKPTGGSVPNGVEQSHCSLSVSGKVASIPVPHSVNLDPTPPHSPSGSEPSSPNGQSLPDNKRPRPEINNNHESLDLSTSAPASCMRDTSHMSELSELRSPPVSRMNSLSCKESLVDTERLRDLLSREPHYHPNNAFLFYVNPEVEDKVDAALRNEAVHNLRFMHNAFFNLSTETFCKAINLIDRFIVKVKVKPKYMACVATASYCAASKLTHPKIEDAELPAPDTLVHITRCGGNGADLIRMEEILASKLSNDLDGVNAYDFLRLFIDALVVEGAKSPPNSRSNGVCMKTENELSPGAGGNAVDEHVVDDHRAKSVSTNDPVENGTTEPIVRPSRAHCNQLLKRVMTRLEIALCSLEIYRFRPVCLALGILTQSGVNGLLPLANTCRVEWSEVCECARLVDELYEVYYRDPLPSSRRQMVWNLSRRTLFRIGYSSPTPLDTISEDCEPADDDEWLLPLLFEP